MSGSATIGVLKAYELIDELEFSIGDKVLVGRNEGAGLFLDSLDVSRRHALLVLEEDGVVVRDLSRNGVLHGGRRLDVEETVPWGAAIEIGSFTLSLNRFDDAPRDDLGRIKRRVLRKLIEHVDLETVEREGEALRPRVEAALGRLIAEARLPGDTAPEEIVRELSDEALGLGPLERLLEDDEVSEIMVVAPDVIFAERGGRLTRTDLGFTSEKAVRTVIERIITPLGRRVDESSAMVDARLADGSRVNAVIPPLAVRGACITIRKFSRDRLGVDDLIGFGSLTRPMADFLCRAVAERANVVVSGGTGSGKTTLLGVLSAAIPEEERIVTVEDAAELRLDQLHVVTLESRPPNTEGKGEVTIRDLVRNALRMRPDRIVVGECRGGEALDMLQAMNTGHDGSLTTLHANSPKEAISRLETLCLMAGFDLPSRAVREQIAQAVDLIVQQSRFADGARRVTSITEVVGLEDDGTVRLNEIFRFVSRPKEPGGGSYLATGWLPARLGEELGALALDAGANDG